MRDSALHAIAGAALAAALYWLAPWSIAPVVLFVGLMREQAQHRDEGLIGWVSWHRLGEAAMWGVGAAVLVVAAWLLERL